MVSEIETKQVYTQAEVAAIVADSNDRQLLMLWENYNGQTIRDVHFRHAEHKKLSGKDDFKSIVVQASGLIQTGVNACFSCQNHRSPYQECIKVSADQVTNLGVWAQSCGGCVWSNQHPGCNLRTTGPSAKSKPYCFRLIDETANELAVHGALNRTPAADEDDNDDDAARQLLSESKLRYDLRNVPLYRCIDQRHISLGRDQDVDTIPGLEKTIQLLKEQVRMIERRLTAKINNQPLKLIGPESAEDEEDKAEEEAQCIRVVEMGMSGGGFYGI